MHLFFTNIYVTIKYVDVWSVVGREINKYKYQEYIDDHLGCSF